MGIDTFYKHILESVEHLSPVIIRIQPQMEVLLILQVHIIILI
jgi:hypothetical protein